VTAGKRVAALIPAHDEADEVGATVRTIAPFDEVFVIDDGSDDGTAAAALEAGAAVLRIPRRIGKGRALEGALRRVPRADIWLLADADLGRTAGGLQVLVECVLAGAADLAIASFPPQPGGGFGMVKTFAARSISLLARQQVREPLSGQRAITSACLAAVRPLAAGFGVETAMTIDAARAGFRVTEIPVGGLRHRATHRSLRGFRHRGRQGMDIVRAVARRVAPRRRRPGAA
jgi:glycosyl transferase family 2